MATYTVTKSKHATLTASTVDTVTITGGAWNSQLEVKNRDTGALEIYWTDDGSVPTVGGDNTYVCMAGEALATTAANDVVKLISSGTPAYSVTALPS